MTAFAVDQAVDGVARRQHGVFSRDQVRRLGATPRMIDRRLTTGRWLRLGPGVYALPSHPGTWHRALMAAVIGERDAVAGGRSAAALHALTDFRMGRPEIVVPAGAHARSGLAIVHRSSDRRRTVIDHIPVLTLADTFFALAGVVPIDRVEVALDDVLAAGRLSIDELQRRHLELVGSRRPGLTAMRRLIQHRSMDGYEPPQSVLEGLLYRVLDRPGMPVYTRQAPLPWAPGQRADAMLVRAPVLIEADGRRWHTRVADLDRDRMRDRLAARHGYRTLRFGQGDLEGEPDRVAAEIRAAAIASAPSCAGS